MHTKVVLRLIFVFLKYVIYGILNAALKMHPNPHKTGKSILGTHPNI